MFACRSLLFSHLSNLPNFTEYFFICRIFCCLGEKDSSFDYYTVGAEFFCELVKAATGCDHIVYYYDLLADDLRRYDDVGVGFDGVSVLTAMFAFTGVGVLDCVNSGIVIISLTKTPCKRGETIEVGLSAAAGHKDDGWSLWSFPILVEIGFKCS